MVVNICCSSKPRVPDEASSTAQQQQQHHTLMIAQDATDIFFNYSTYEDAYLDYLFRPASAGVVPSDAEVIPCLVIQELGPFSVNDKRDLRMFVHIVLALLIWQFQPLDAGRLIEEALRDLHDDSDEDEERGYP